MTQNSVFMLLCQGHHSLDNSHMEVKIGRLPTIDLQQVTKENIVRTKNWQEIPQVI